MGKLYTVLHQNILDVFNAYGIQIMTPAYVRDPEPPKVVPKEQWSWHRQQILHLLTAPQASWR
jgi:hypothetical protein